MYTVSGIADATPVPQPSSMDIDSFKEGLKNMSVDDLLKMIFDPSLTTEQKDALTSEFVGRFEMSQQGEVPEGDVPEGEVSQDDQGGDGMSSGVLDELLGKLMSGEALTDDELAELKELFKAMGVGDAQIDEIVNLVRGLAGFGGKASADSGEIR